MEIFKKRSFIVVLFIILSIVTITSLGIAIYLNKESKVNIIEPVLAKEIDNNIENNDLVYVEVKGAVKKPGVYEVSNKAIINDVIIMAGGFTKNALSTNINLSRKVENELVIYVFTKSEYNKKKSSCSMDNNNTSTVTETVTTANKECASNGYLIDNCTDEKISVISSSDNIVPEVISNNDTTNTLININTASLSELSTLPGIGDSKANAIIDYRKQNRFNTIDDLLNVSGISEKTFEKLKELITV